jgi:hypothetical protein
MRWVRALAGGLALLAATGAGAHDAPPSPQAEKLYAEARELAKGDPVILAEIEAAQAEVSRGVLDGKAVAMRQMIPGGASWSVPLARRAGEPLTIAVRRVGAMPVTLRVVDAAGAQLCADTTAGATLTCRIAPGSGAIAVKVANPGAASAEAMLITN